MRNVHSAEESFLLKSLKFTINLKVDDSKINFYETYLKH